MRYRLSFVMGLISFLSVLALIRLPSVTAEQSATARAMTPSPSNNCFIPTLYFQVLNRLPTSFEITDGLNYLGSHSRTLFSTQLLTSPEYQTNLIQSGYHIFLGRSPTPPDIDHWLTIFGGGGSDEFFSANLLGSNEYFQLPQVGGTNPGFVTAIYLVLLHRPVDPGGLNSWLTALGSGTTRFQVAQSLLSSAEYQTDLIQGWYQKFLGRVATPSEITVWLSFFGTSGTDEQIIASITGSDEYFSRAGICQINLPIILR